METLSDETIVNILRSILYNDERQFRLPDNDDLSSRFLLELVTMANNKCRHKPIYKKIGYKKIKEIESLNDKCCSICIEDYRIGEYKKTLTCNHTFHKRCIDRWFRKDHNDCPLCREKIKI